MRKVFAASAAGLMLAFGLATVASPAAAETSGNHQVQSDCNTGWYTNPDEGDRLPEQMEGGFKFEDADLVHHAADLKLGDLEPGSFTASPQPDQPSFFSVEVRDESTGAYGTLRWTGSTWTLTTNVDTFSHAEPADFIGTDTKWGELTDAARVFSFGVGYTANPPGTVVTVVSSVTFAGNTYDLTCEPKPTLEQVTPNGPTVKTPTCDFAKDVTLPTETGVTYTSVLLNDGKKLLVTAAASDPDKYELKDYPANGWTIELSPAKDCTSETTSPSPSQTTTDPGNGGGGPVPSQTSEPAPSMSTSNAAAGGGLPVTGESGGIAKLIGMLAVGGILIAGGGLLLVSARRRRDAGTVESA